MILRVGGKEKAKVDGGRIKERGKKKKNVAIERAKTFDRLNKNTKECNTFCSCGLNLSGLFSGKRLFHYFFFIVVCILFLFF